MELGEKIKALRIERGLTQEQLAAKLYVSRTAVSKWETGGGTPNLDSLQALARLFEVSVDDLLSAGDLIVLARDERRSSARSDGMLSRMGRMSRLPICNCSATRCDVRFRLRTKESVPSGEKKSMRKSPERNAASTRSRPA